MTVCRSRKCPILIASTDQNVLRMYITDRPRDWLTEHKKITHSKTTIAIVVFERVFFSLTFFSWQHLTERILVVWGIGRFSFGVVVAFICFSLRGIETCHPAISSGTARQVLTERKSANLIKLAKSVSTLPHRKSKVA